MPFSAKLDKNLEKFTLAQEGEKREGDHRRAIGIFVGAHGMASRVFLMVDEEPNLFQTFTMIFQVAGHSVTAARNYAEAIHLIKNETFDLVFLDIKNKGVESSKVLDDIFFFCPQTPILLLTDTASLEIAQRAVPVRGCDYFVKPVDPAQILRRVDEILAKKSPSNKGLSYQADQPRFLFCGSFVIDLLAHKLTTPSLTVALTPGVFQCLVALARSAPNPVPVDQLVPQATPEAFSPWQAHQIARVQIHRLRRAIEPDPHHPRYILTARGVGYRLIT